MKRLIGNENHILNGLCWAYQFKRKKSWYKKYGFYSYGPDGTIWNFPEDVWYELIELADIIRTYIKN